MAEKRRIVTGEREQQEVSYENRLRPQTLDEYIGQEKAKEKLIVTIEAEKKRGEALDKEEIVVMVRDYTAGVIPDYQKTVMIGE